MNMLLLEENERAELWLRLTKTIEDYTNGISDLALGPMMKICL
jgi:hypothetical protein